MLNVKALVGAFNQEKALRALLLRDCTTLPINRLQHYVGHRLLATIIDQVITDTFSGAEAAAAARKLQTLPHAFLHSVFRMHKTRSCKVEGLIILLLVTMQPGPGWWPQAPGAAGI